MGSTELTCGERIVRSFLGQPVDRLPFGTGIGWCPWGQTVERWREQSGIADLNIWELLGYDHSFAAPPVQYGLWPGFPEETLEETEEHVILRDRRGIVMRQRKDRASMPDWLSHPVKTQDDWEQIKAEHLRPDAPGRLGEEQAWREFLDRIANTGEAVMVGTFPYGVFGTPRDLMGAEEVLVAFYDQPEMVQDMMDTLTGLWISVYERVADRVQVDRIHIWEDMSGRQGSLISPAMVEQFMMPCYDRIADFARRRGVRLISVDTDGNCAELVPVMMRHGVNVFEPFEVQAGNDVREYRRQYPTLGIWGGLDKRALAADRPAVDAEIDRCRQMIRAGRYVPGFDHLIAPDARWELFEYAAREIRALCHAAHS